MDDDIFIYEEVMMAAWVAAQSGVNFWASVMIESVPPKTHTFWLVAQNGRKLDAPVSYTRRKP